ncbi:MAG TPA: aminotransferase class I/II-fold pyridoxal phosphate-dependent enzyme [Acidobacteriota bacterium]|nr:aminotransferase class I/II-fold pyridoxal phosphate-dependent enzyme [Acidobacteriota bacterium]
MTRQRLLSRKAMQFTESVIREMTRLANLHGAINLAQGMPDFSAPDEIKDAACRAIMDDINQYAITWGAKAFRDAIAAKTSTFLNLEIDPEKEITVTCGSTEAMIAALLATIDPGDEVIIFEPFYENYGPDTILSGAVPRFVPLRAPDWRIDLEELERAFNNRTRGIIINTPNNPTGKVFSREELTFIAGLCCKWNVIAITDEIYEHIIYDGRSHCAMAGIEGMRDRTVAINGMSKTYSVTGWRVGYAIAAPHLTEGIRKVHDFLTVGAPAPLQEAGVRALALPPRYYTDLAAAYQSRRDLLLEALRNAGFRCGVPEGAYYIMADFSGLSDLTDTEFTRRLVADIGIAAVPGGSFFHEPARGRGYVRFCFCKKESTLQAAKGRLMQLSSGLTKR